MILARLQAIDGTLYEAADVDGAGDWAQVLVRHHTRVALCAGRHLSCCA